MGLWSARHLNSKLKANWFSVNSRFWQHLFIVASNLIHFHSDFVCIHDSAASQSILSLAKVMIFFIRFAERKKRLNLFLRCENFRRFSVHFQLLKRTNQLTGKRSSHVVAAIASHNEQTFAPRISVGGRVKLFFLRVYVSFLVFEHFLSFWKTSYSKWQANATCLSFIYEFEIV